jgi:hypothetical protein
MQAQQSRSFAGKPTDAATLDTRMRFSFVCREMGRHRQTFRPANRLALDANRWITFAMLVCFCQPSAGIRGQEVPVGAAATNAVVKQIRPGVFELGQVRFDKNQRTISLPASVNLREGNIEYVVVTATGKTHESLLRTTAEPYHVQLAFLLLSAKGSGTNALPEDPAQSLPGEKIEIEFVWTGVGTNSFRAEDFVHDRKANGPARRGTWIYTGSRLREDGFAAQLDGSIVSLITDADALINSPRPGREDDDNWLVRTNNLPLLNAPVEVTFRLIR